MILNKKVRVSNPEQGHYNTGRICSIVTDSLGMIIGWCVDWEGHGGDSIGCTGFEFVTPRKMKCDSVKTNIRWEAE